MLFFSYKIIFFCKCKFIDICIMCLSSPWCFFRGLLSALSRSVPLRRFDLSHRKWERLPDMLGQRDHFSAACLDGKVFALGGNRDDSQYLDAVEYYSPEENTWRYSATVEVLHRKYKQNLKRRVSAVF